MSARFPQLALALALLAGACECGSASGEDAGLDGGGDADRRDAVAHDAPVIPLDASAYLPRDAGDSGAEPCRGATRRLRFEGLPLDNIADLAGHGDRLAARELDAEAGLLRARVFDVVAGSEIGLSPPIPADGDGRGGLASDEIHAHENGFDLVAWGNPDSVVGHLDREGALLEMQRYTRDGPPVGLVPGALVRIPRGLVVLTHVGGEGTQPLALDVLADDGSLHSVPLGIDAREVAGSIAALDADRIVGAVALSSSTGRDPARLVRFDVDLATERVVVAEAGEAPTGSVVYGSSGAVSAHVDGAVAVAAFALGGEIGEDSGLRLVWWTPGGAELARTERPRVSIEGLGVLGIAGSMPHQTVGMLTGQRYSRGSLLAGRIVAPGSYEGGSSPLAIGVGLRHGVTWTWTTGGIAIAYSGNGRIEVLVACEGML